MSAKKTMWFEVINYFIKNKKYHGRIYKFVVYTLKGIFSPHGEDTEYVNNREKFFGNKN